MITLQDIVAAELARRSAGSAWYAAQRRASDTALPKAERVEAAIAEIDLREAMHVASRAFDAVVDQAVKEATP